MSLLIKTFILLPFCSSPLDSWDLNLKAPASHCIPLIKPRKQRGSELDSQECIYLFILFIIFAVPILPAAALQRWHLFSQTTRLFPPSCCFKLFSKDMCQTLPDERPRLHIGKIWIFPLFLPPLKCSPLRALFPTCAQYKGVGSLCEQIWTNKLSCWNRAP